MTLRGENGSAASAAAPPELHSGCGGCLGLSHESRTSGQIMNVCIHSRGDAPPDHHSCLCGCDDGGREKEPPQKEHGQHPVCGQQLMYIREEVKKATQEREG